MRIEDVTNAADLGMGAFYNYFDSKDDLFAVLLSEAIEPAPDCEARSIHTRMRRALLASKPARAERP